MLTVYKKVAVVLVGIMLVPSFAFAQGGTATAQTSAELQAKITALLAQINALQEQLKTTQQQVVEVKKELAITRSLSLGSEGEDVKSLQEWLSQFPDIYPEKKVTGYYGKMTEKAIKAYQKKYGLEQAGRVGPKTREHIRNMWQKNYASSTASTNHWDDEDDDKKGNGQDKITICHSGNTLVVAEPALKAHLAHGDIKGACSSTTTPDTTAPVISSVVIMLATSTASVGWTTNEVANSVVRYGMVSPVVGATSTLTVENASNVTSHSVILTGLTPSTVYYFVVISKDVAGNTATSSEGIFTTSAVVVPDTTVPIISGVSATTSSTTATVAWTTNETSSTKVKYATSTPVLSAGTIFTTEDASMVTSHSIVLTGLIPNTTYYYLPISVDLATNTATGTEVMFTTGI